MFYLIFLLEIFTQLCSHRKDFGKIARLLPVAVNIYGLILGSVSTIVHSKYVLVHMRILPMTRDCSSVFSTGSSSFENRLVTIMPHIQKKGPINITIPLLWN